MIGAVLFALVVLLFVGECWGEARNRQRAAGGHRGIGRESGGLG